MFRVELKLFQEWRVVGRYSNMEQAKAVCILFPEYETRIVPEE